LRERNRKAVAPSPKKEDLSDELSKLFDDGTTPEKSLPPESSETRTTRLNSTHDNSTQLNSTHINQPQNKTTEKPIAPERDFNRRPNSLERDALPTGMFPGTSKKLYDALYLRTRGAVKPVRAIQATRTEVMRWAGIGGLNTFLSHIKHLTRLGLIVRQFEIGNKEGAIYEVRIPEELSPTDSTQLDSTQLDSTQINSTPNRVHDSTQKLMRVESSNPIENKDSSGEPKTSFKTKTNDDEQIALSDLTAILSEAAQRVTGRAPKAEESAQWADLARVLVAELDEAAARSGGVSSVPAFLAEHLRRKLAHKSKTRHREGKQHATATETSPPTAAPPDPNRRLTPEEITEQARVIADVIEGGYTIEQAEAQFAGSFHAEDWAAVRSAVLAQG